MMIDGRSRVLISFVTLLAPIVVVVIVVISARIARRLS